MASWRKIHRDISFSARFHRCAERSRLVWLQAYPFTDRAGRVPGAAIKLSALAFEMANLEDEEIEACLVDLCENRLGWRYLDSRGRSVFVFSRFFEFQGAQARLHLEAPSKWSDPTDAQIPDWEDATLVCDFVKRAPDRFPVVADKIGESRFIPVSPGESRLVPAQIRSDQSRAEHKQEPARARISKDDAGLPPEFDGCRWAPDEIEHAFEKSYREKMKRPLRVNRKDREEFLLRPCPELQPVDDLEGFFADAIDALNAKSLAVTLRSCVNALSWVPLRTDATPVSPEDSHPMFRKAVSPFAPKAD